MARPQNKLREKLWWFDVVYPIALATFLFGSLTYIVYSGQRQWRLAQQAEKKLLELSLVTSAGRPVQEKGAVASITASPTDVMRLERAPLGRLPDTSVAAYARVVTRLVDSGVPLIFVHWDSEAHPTDEVYYLPLVEAMRRAHGRAKVYLITSENAFTALPAELRDYLVWADETICDEPDVVQIECSYLAGENTWVMQAILTELGESSSDKAPLPSWASPQLSSIFPQYILNLSPASDITHLSFSDVLAGRGLDQLRGVRAAFVGADQSYSSSGYSDSSVTRQVLTPYDARNKGKPDVVGTPLHVFWAMTAQMYADKAMVVVPSQAVIVAVTIAFCVLVTVVLVMFGGLAAVGMFLVYVITSPFMNAFAIRHLQVYLPLFDSFYFGLSTIVVVGLVRLSVTAFGRWRLAAQQRLHAHIADLKGNFVSLLSHNLNTPVAKMQGMLSVLTMQPAASPWLAAASSAESLVTQLEFSIRCVLVASTLEEKALNESPRTVKALRDEFVTTSSASLKKLGLKAVVPDAEADEDDQLFLPLTFDVRALTTALSALAALFSTDSQSASLTIRFRAGERDARPTLTVTIESPEAWIDAGAAETLTAAEPRDVRSLGGGSFFPEVMAGFAGLAVRTYRGTLTVAPGHSGGGRIVATFESSGSPAS